MVIIVFVFCVKMDGFRLIFRKEFFLRMNLNGMFIINIFCFKLLYGEVGINRDFFMIVLFVLFYDRIVFFGFFYLLNFILYWGICY